MKPLEICKGIYWIGALDWNIRNFHGYSTDQGTTYNSYLVVDDKIALIDSVKHPFVEQQLAAIREIVDPCKIDYVISNHTEMDHSGGLPKIMQAVGENKPLYCSKMGEKHLKLHFHKNWNYQPISVLQELNLGKKTLTFVETRMLHWPDSMATYVKQDKLLFSSDAFGQHYAGVERFDYEMGDAIMPYAKKYFANILLLYSPLIIKLLQSVKDMGLELETICPDHGIIWKKDPMKIINAYAKWSEQKPLKKAVVVYDTMWHSTEKMAYSIVNGLADTGINTKCMSLRSCNRSDIMTDILDAGAVIIGSPTLNNGLYPTIGDFLTYMKGLKPKNKIGAAFGSYGWSGESVKLIQQELQSIGFDMPDTNALRIQYVPGETEIKSCYEFGRKIGLSLSQLPTC